ILPGARVRVAEDLDAAQPHRRGHAVAVRIEVLGRREAYALEIHLAAVDDRLQRRSWDWIGAHGGGELTGDRMLGRRPRLEAARHVLAPARQARPLGGRIATEIGDVIHGATEGV